MPTSHWALPTPAGTDLISAGDDNITSLSTLMDDAAKFAMGALASRGTAASRKYGFFYLATDVGILYVSDGTNWFEVSVGGGAVPIGGTLDYAGNGDPADTRYLLADGRAVSRTTYAALFTALSTTYGGGDGSTTFNLPDLRGRVSVGPDNMGTAAGAAGRLSTNNARGNVGGSQTHTLAAGEMPVHTHTITSSSDTVANHNHTISTDGSHSHSITGGGHEHFYGDTYFEVVGSGGYNAIDGGFMIAAIGHVAGTTGGGGHSHGVSTDGSHTHTLGAAGGHAHVITSSAGNAGSGAAHNNLQPYQVVNKIIRVL